MIDRNYNVLQFFSETTGYVPNSSPPEFRKGLVRLEPSLGSGTRIYFDARLGWDRLVQEAENWLKTYNGVPRQFKLYGKNRCTPIQHIQDFKTNGFIREV